MLKEIFIIGIGGEGAQTIGEILSISACTKNFATSFYPFYGSQMRGGESGCIIKIDTEGNDITNPTINMPDDFLILNDTFFDKYKKFASDTSKYYQIDNSNIKNKNIKLLKKYIDESKLFDEEIIINAIKEKFKKEETYNKVIGVYKNEL